MVELVFFKRNIQRLCLTATLSLDPRPAYYPMPLPSSASHCIGLMSLSARTNQRLCVDREQPTDEFALHVSGQQVKQRRLFHIQQVVNGSPTWILSPVFFFVPNGPRLTTVQTVPKLKLLLCHSYLTSVSFFNSSQSSQNSERKSFPCCHIVVWLRLM